jgi:adenine-specific DNA methylase
VLSPERVRAQLSSQQGGTDVLFDEKGRRVGGALILAVVTVRAGQQGRHYRSGTEHDYRMVWEATTRLDAAAATPLPNGMSRVPDEPLPPVGTLGFRVQRYGMLQWADLFTARQKLVLVELANAMRKADLAEGCREALSLVLSRMTDYGSAQVSWASTGEFVRGTFGRQALPMVWDFAEPVPFSDSSGNFDGALDWVVRVVEQVGFKSTRGQAQIGDAGVSPLPDASAEIWFTDPPYYDAIPYADLSDFFFVWLKRSLPGHPLLRDPFDAENALTPKAAEAVQDETKCFEGKAKDRTFFESSMARAFAEGRRILKESGIASVVFAHKTTEGWEALLSGMIRGGWTIKASWPIATERPGRLRSQNSAALATSVHLICRPREKNAPIGEWASVRHELSKRVADWMERLQPEGIRGADVVYACRWSIPTSVKFPSETT